MIKKIISGGQTGAGILGTVIQFNFLKTGGSDDLRNIPLKYKILLNQRFKFMKD